MPWRRSPSSVMSADLPEALGELLALGGVTEIMINAGEVWLEREGALRRWPEPFPVSAVHELIEQIVGPRGARVDRSSPIVDVRLADGSRVNIVIPPLAIDGPCVTIRRFAADGFDLSELVAVPEVADLLSAAVADRVDIIVSGGTGSGKTTLLNALAAHVPPFERLITIEDTAELRLDHPHVVRLETRDANAEGSGRVETRTLVRTALRMRPDRIIIGEVRGAEVLDLLAAMNTGHEGSMSTVHANGPTDALRRLETMGLLAGADIPVHVIRGMISSAVDLIVQLRRVDGGGRRIDGVVAIEAERDQAREEADGLCVRHLVVDGVPVESAIDGWHAAGARS